VFSSVLVFVVDLLVIPEGEDFFLGGREGEIVFKRVESHCNAFCYSRLMYLGSALM
jgi:hypothetical protein